jgi:hypothetical protein
MDQTERDPQAASEDIEAASPEEQDTQGNSMLSYELGRDVVAERQRQATDAVRDAGRSRAAREHSSKKGRSLRDRLFGR